MIGEPSPSSRQENSVAVNLSSPFQRRAQTRPQLGDFSSLRLAATYSNPSPYVIRSQDIASEGGSSQLGDLSKVVSQFWGSELEPRQLKGANLTGLEDSAPQGNTSLLSSVSDTEIGSPIRKIKKILSRTSTSTPPSRRARQQPYSSKILSDLAIALPNSGQSSSQANSFQSKPEKRQEASSKPICILKREVVDKRLVTPALGTTRTKDEVRASLSRHLIPHCRADRRVARKFPANASHGLYVFLDMSNIEISFQTALRKRCGLADSAKLTGLPRLNLQFLTELLVRGRAPSGLHVGCSVVPGRREPRFVQDLRELGYQVDVRERKRVEHSGGSGSGGGGASSSSTTISPSKPSRLPIRYVEDLVDETLQTRIAEAVMEHFQEQGTIVLATGDAKPAQYSDGFFRYVERALRMGWNVELVAWHGSLASSWKNAGWTGLWKDKFRVIELDSFIDDLLDV